MTPKRWLLTALSFAAAVGVSLYIVLTSWPAQRVPVALPLAAHAMALAALVIEVCARGAKIRLSAAALRIPLRFGSAVRTSLGGDFGAAITPARSGAEPARFLILAESRVAVPNVLLLLFAEMFLETISLAVVAAALAVVFQGAGAMMSGLIGLVLLYAVGVLGAGFVGVALARRNAHGPPPVWARRIGLHAGRWRTVQRALRQLRASMTSLRTARPGLVTLSLGCSVLHIAARMAILPALVYPLDATVPLAPLLLWPLALVYGGVVAPVPGGGGVIEIAFRATLGGAIPAPIFGSALIWWRVYTFYAYVVLGALAAGGTVMRAIRNRGDSNRACADREGDGTAFNAVQSRT